MGDEDEDKKGDITMTSYKRGSEWHKWDLHLHTPKTWLGNQFGTVSTDNFVSKVVESGVAVVGLTNYFKFADGEISGADNIKNKLEAQGVVVFPNLELRLSHNNKKSELCDYHIIFDSELNVEKINTFLSNLDVHKAGGKVAKASMLTDTDLKSNSLYVDLETLIITLNDESLGIGECVLCGFLSRGKGESRSASIMERIWNNSAFVIHSSDSEKNIQTDYEFWTKDDSKPIKPIFQGSDAHKLDDIGNKFTWVKAQPTFEWLRQVAFNPAERTRFQDNSPISIKSKGMIIDKIVYGDSNTEIEFNYDLISIIGKRGNGKSILLKAIASKIDKDTYRDKVGEKTNKDIEWRNKVFGNNFEVIWGDGSTNSGEDDNLKKVFYLPQGYLSNLAYDENEKEKERDAFLRILLRTNDEFKNAEDKARIFANSNGLHISDLVNRIFIDIDDIKRLEEDNKNVGSIANIKFELDDINNSIKTISDKHQITDDDNKRYQEATTEQERLSSKIRIFAQDIEILSNIAFHAETVTISDALFFGLSDELKIRINKKLENSSKKSLREIVDNQKATLSKQKTDAENQLIIAETTISELKPKFEQQKELSGLTEKKLELEKNKNQIEKNQKMIAEKIKSKSEILAAIKTSYFAYKTEQAKCFNTVSFDGFEFIDITISINKKNHQLDTCVSNNINLNRNQNLSEKSKDFLSGENRDLTEENFEAILFDLLDDKFVLKANAEKKHAVHELLNNPYSIDFLDSIKTKNIGTLFRNMTGGQKAIAMLELIFEFDQNHYPIMLDQPEDDLDTSGVTTSVVEFIKKQKELRQIFIVSHNGSLVVCADSEEIIVAAHENNKFSYSVGAIEDEKTRKAIVDILEGGKDALQLRMKKLRI